MENLTKLDDQTERLFADLEGWSPERLQFRPARESWSILEILDHLILTERAVLVTMRRNLASNNKVRLYDRYRSAFVLAIMFLPTRLQVSGSVKSLLPSRNKDDLRVLRSEWADDRKGLTAFLEGLSSADRKKGVFRHPVGGWTTPDGALFFLRSHLHHHGYQIAKIRKASKRI